MSAIETAIASGTWAIDATHSSIGFEVKHLGVSTFRGTLGEVSGSVVTDEGAVRSVEGAAAVASLVTVDPALTGHLLSADFFAADNHPQARFRSTAVEATGDDLTVRGDLELRGVSHPVELRGRIEGTAVDPYGNERLALSATGVIDRTAYGISWNAPLANGALTVAEKVRLVLDVEAIRNAS
jgi:polyisoprenoid-binding protein YceI